MDINAAVGSELGLSDEKIWSLDKFEISGLFSDREKVALRYADAMTLSDQDVSDELYAEVQTWFSEDEILELTEAIAWENEST